MPSNRQVVRKSLVVTAAAGVAAAALSAAGTVGAATYFARRVLTPDRFRPDDTQILAIEDESVTLELTAESVQPGRYGLC